MPNNESAIFDEVEEVQIDEEKELNAPLTIGESKIASAPHIPEVDARIKNEIDADPRVTSRFVSNDIRTEEETIEALNPKWDIKIIKELLDPYVSYDDSEVLEKRIEMKQNINGNVERNMIGWVALFRTDPNRINRFINEGILNQDDYDQEQYPVLEITYARHKDAQKGVMIDGIKAEIYRLFNCAMDNESKSNDFNQLMQSRVPVSYNNLVPTRIIATTDLDNEASSRILENLGFVYKGKSLFETPEESDDKDNPRTVLDNVYELDWDLFIKKIDEQISPYWEEKLEK